MATDTFQGRDAGRCRVCGDPCAIALTNQGVESCCAICIQMFDWFRDWLDREAGMAPESVGLSSSLVHAHRGDSFGLVELLMELEHEFGVTIPHEPGIQFETLEDAIRCIRLTSLPEEKRVTQRFWSRTRTARRQVSTLSRRPGSRSCGLISEPDGISQQADIANGGTADFEVAAPHPSDRAPLANVARGQVCRHPSESD